MINRQINTSTSVQAIEILKEEFPKKYFLRASEAANFLGLEKATLYNWKLLNKSPFPIQRLNGALVIPIVGLAKYLDSLNDEDSNSNNLISTQSGKRRGRKPNQHKTNKFDKE